MSKQSIHNRQKPTILILGAGPAGLTAAYSLLKSNPNLSLTVLESSHKIGGISKTVEYNGNRMDLGGHRFFTRSREVNDLWCELLGDRLKSRRRISHIYFNGKTYDYPISLNKSTLKNLGIKKSIKITLSYLGAKILPRKEETLEDYFINHFGSELYKMFFENYTKTVWGKHPSKLSAEWGAQRVKGVSILTVLKKAILKKTEETSMIEEFIYPDLGPGEMWSELEQKIESLGGKIVKNVELKSLKNHSQKIKELVYKTQSGEIITERPDYIISSIPLKTLVEKIDKKPDKIKKIAARLPYRDYLTVGLLLGNSTNVKITTMNDTWLYIHDRSVRLGRIQIYNNWSKKLVKDPKNTTWVGLEYFCQKTGKFYNFQDEKIVQRGISDLKKLGLISSEKDVLDSHVERVEKAYPAYLGSYEKLPRLKKYLDKIDNLYCIGRNGQHRYNNMDHSMLTGLRAAENITKRILSGEKIEKTPIWNVNTEKEYHEIGNLDEENSVEIKQSNKKTTILGLPKPLFVAFLLWGTITLATALVFHENWEDEAQAWLLARDCLIPDLIARMKIEGHFLPWYLLIMPFAKLGFPYKTINLLNWILFAWGVYLFLKHYPGKPWKKILLTFSSAFVFWYPVVARCYCLLLPGIMLMIKNYKDRYARPFAYFLPLLLIVNTHIHCLAFAFLIGLDYLLGWLKLRHSLSKNKNKQIFTAIALVLVLTILSGLPIVGAVGTPENSAASNVNFSTEGVTLTTALTGPLIFFSNFLANAMPAIPIYICLAIFIINLLKNKSSVFWKISISLLFSLLLQAFIFPLYLPQRIFMIIFFYLFFSATEKIKRYPLWTETPIFILLIIATIQTGNVFCSIFLFTYLAMTLLPVYLEKYHSVLLQQNIQNLAKLSLVLLGVFSAFSGLLTIYGDYKYLYTDAKRVADYLSETYSNEEEIIVLVDEPPLAIYLPILAYLPGNYKFIDIRQGSPFTYANEIAINLGSYMDPDKTQQPNKQESNDAPNNALVENINYSNECKKYISSSEQPCLYLSFYDPSFFEKITKSLEESGIISNVKTQELNGTLTLLIDSVEEGDKFEQAPYEHYRLYGVKINSEK